VHIPGAVIPHLQFDYGGDPLRDPALSLQLGRLHDLPVGHGVLTSLAGLSPDGLREHEADPAHPEPLGDGIDAGLLVGVPQELERARRRGADLEERLRQLAGEGQAWLGVARSHEAVAAGLRATLDKVLQQPAVAAAGGGECGVAEDAQSCCFVASPSGLVAGDSLLYALSLSSPSC
jgi:hypothetical protein